MSLTLKEIKKKLQEMEEKNQKGESVDLKEMKELKWQAYCRQYDPQTGLYQALVSCYRNLPPSKEDFSKNQIANNYVTLLDLLSIIASETPEKVFQTVVVPMRIKETRLEGIYGPAGVIYDYELCNILTEVGVLSREIAKSCSIAQASCGATNHRALIYFCPEKLWLQLNKYKDIEDWEKEYELPVLRGSPKQIDWARVLRQRMFPQILKNIDDYKSQDLNLSVELNKLSESFRLNDMAKDWIDWRDFEPSGLIEKGLERAIKIQNKLKELAGEINVSIEDRVLSHQVKYPIFEGEAFLEWFNNKPEEWKVWAKAKPLSEMNKMRRIEISRFLAGKKMKSN